MMVGLVLTAFLVSGATNTPEAELRHFSGIVVGLDGRPAEGAKVRLFPVPAARMSMCGGDKPVRLFDEGCRRAKSFVGSALRDGTLAAKPAAEASTRTDGRYELSAPFDEGWLVAHSDGVGAVARRVRAGADGTAVELTRFAPVRVRLGLSVGDKRPEAHAFAVWIVSRDTNQVWRATRTSAGLVADEVPSGVRLVAVLDAPGYESEWSQFHPPEQATLTFSETPTVRGRVLRDGIPVAGARVWAGHNGSEPITMSRHDGSFVLELNAGDHDITAVHGGMAGAATAIGDRPVDVELKPAATLTLNVRDAETGAPIKNANIWSKGGMRTLPSGRGSSFSGTYPEAVFVQEAPGRYVARSVGRGPYTVSVTAPTYLPDGRGPTVEITGAEASLDVDLRKGLRITGKVIERKTEAAIHNATVTAQPKKDGKWGGQAWTAEDGSFELYVAKGNYSLEASAQGFTDVKRELGAPLTAPIEFALKRAQGIEVTVSGPDGRPAPDAHVIVERLEHNRWHEEHGFSHDALDASGRLVLTPLERGRYRIQARQEGFDRSKAYSVEFRGETARVALRLRPGLRIGGRAVDPRGAPAANVTFVVGPQEVRTESDGSFEVTGLEDREYVITFPSKVRGMVRFVGNAPRLRAGDLKALIVLPDER